LAITKKRIPVIEIMGPVELTEVSYKARLLLTVWLYTEGFGVQFGVQCKAFGAITLIDLLVV
jgi:hypothetical protein